MTKHVYEFKKSGLSEYGKEYRVLRNKAQKIIEKRKRKNFHNTIVENRGNMKKVVECYQRSWF